MIHYNCFKDKVCLITGGSSGIGLMAAKKFAEQGARIIIIDIDDDHGNRAIDYFNAIDAEATFMRADVSNEAEIKNALERIEAIYGRLDYAYNSAGIGGEFATVADYPASDWNKVIATNLTGVFLCMKYEIPLMLKSSETAIVNCASVLSTVAHENDSAYVASKFGVLGLTKNAALEYAKTNLRINSISPGFTRTPMIDKNENDREKLKLLAEKHPIGRIAMPAEIADGVLWLCSPGATFAIGMNLLIDGGYTLQ